MDYCDAVNDAVEFIEKHIREPMSAEQIAGRAGYSLYHFSRVFTAQKGVPLMDYVRMRRLSTARTELTKGRKVIDVALEFGYETASGFAKAFRKEFGYSPSTYVVRMQGTRHNVFLSKGGETMLHPVLVKKESFNVAGYGIKTNITSGYTKDIAAYWDTYTGENLESKMYAQLNPPKHGEVGLCVSSPHDETVTYLLGVVVEDFRKATSDMIRVVVPEAEYAVFTTPPVDLTKAGKGEGDPLAETVKAMWKYIFEEWFPRSGYLYDESKMDFEFYDERCHARPDAVMEIYVPVVKKP